MTMKASSPMNLGKVHQLLISAALGLAVLFAARTWYYTGIFSVFYGTQRQYLTLWPAGAGLWTVATAMADSVFMVLSVNDPPRWDPYALPVLCDAIREPEARELCVGFVYGTLAEKARCDRISDPLFRARCARTRQTP